MTKSTSSARILTLAEETNPYGTWTATLESDSRTLYLYLTPVDEEDARQYAVWIRNLVPAPIEMDTNAAREERAPIRSRAACVATGAGVAPAADTVDFVWWGEGNAVALHIDGALQAVIPPWAGPDGLYGYSLEAAAAEAGTLPFPDPPHGLASRVQENLEFWSRHSEPGNWEEFRDRMLAAFEERLGKHSRYFAVTDRKVPTLAVLEFQGDSGVLYMTLGMSRQPIPEVELYSKDPERDFRIEVFTGVSRPDDRLPGLMGRIASYPWLASRYLGAGHVYRTGLDEAAFANMLFTDRLPFAGMPETQVDGYPVKLLFAFPATDEWTAVARTKGTDHVWDKLNAEGGS